MDPVLWMDIKTAPKNGHEILVCNMNQGGVTGLVSWDKVHNRWKMKGLPILHMQYTHWIEIPQKPLDNQKDI